MHMAWIARNKIKHEGKYPAREFLGLLSKMIDLCRHKALLVGPSPLSKEMKIEDF